MLHADSMFQKRTEPWIIAVILTALLPLFPEYIAPFLGIGALIAAYRDAKKRRQLFTVGPLGKIMLVYLLFLSVGILYSRNALSAFSAWLMWGVMLTVYVTLHTVLTSRERVDIALFALSTSAGCVGAIACIQYVLRTVFGFSGYLQLWHPLDVLVYRLSPLPVNMEVVGDRACATFNNPNIMAEYLIMAIPFIALYAFNGGRTKARLFSRGCLVLAVCGVSFSFARGSYLALLAIAAVFAIANIRRIALAFLAAFSALALTPPAVFDRLFSISRVKKSVPSSMTDPAAAAHLIAAAGADKAISERFQVWQACLQSFFDHPLLGIGAGVGNTNSMLLAHSLNVPHAHNVVLQLLVEGGIVGLGIFAVAGLKALQTSVRLTRKPGPSRTVGIAALAFLAGFGVNSMVEFPFFTPKLIGVFLLALALFDSAGRLYLEQPASPLADVLVPPLRQRSADHVTVARMK